MDLCKKNHTRFGHAWAPLRDGSAGSGPIAPAFIKGIVQQEDGLQQTQFRNISAGIGSIALAYIAKRGSYSAASSRKFKGIVVQQVSSLFHLH